MGKVEVDGSCRGQRSWVMLGEAGRMNHGGGRSGWTDQIMLPFGECSKRALCIF